MDSQLINKAKSLGKATGQLFYQEFEQAFNVETDGDWDATAWEVDRHELRNDGLSGDQLDELWPIWQEAFIAETERLAEHEILSDDEVFNHLTEIADTGSYKIEENSLYTRREENCDWLFCGEIVNREQVQEQWDSIVATL